MRTVGEIYYPPAYRALLTKALGRNLLDALITEHHPERLQAIEDELCRRGIILPYQRETDGLKVILSRIFRAL